MVRVVFIHPDLGIGGAERLVIDAALALRQKGHEVCFLTAHHDPTHCFPETIDGRLSVICRGDWLPRSFLGYFCAFWAYVRMIYIALYLILFSNISYEVAFVDQISACIPFLHLRKDSKVIFYCHFPDQLLTTRKNILKKFYRFFIDKLEERTTAIADCILVNSNFTSKVFKDTFKSIDISPSILHPSLDLKKFESGLTDDSASDYLFLSLNRYERKKNVSLAIEAFKNLHDKLAQISSPKKARLIIAGGYDERVKENIEYYAELVSLAKQLDVSLSTTFLKSPSDKTKSSLLFQATCLLYTPSGEHFGIVPIESMCSGTPVIAVNSGGPLETVVDGQTGFLMEPTPEDFASAMMKFVDGSVDISSMGKSCRKHVSDKFSFEKFASRLDYIVQSLVDGRKRR